MTEKEFNPGYLFPVKDPKKVTKELRALTKIENFGRWGIRDTSLETYALPLPVNFEVFLREEAKKAGESGRLLKVLDVGIGTGKQWVDFLNENLLEWWGTSLTGKVHAALKGRVINTTAALLHKKFQPDSLDVVVSHFGAHGQNEELIENALHVLRPGGQLILVSDGERPKVEPHSKHYQVIGSTVKNIKEWGIHLRKPELQKTVLERIKSFFSGLDG